MTFNGINCLECFLTITYIAPQILMDCTAIPQPLEKIQKLPLICRILHRIHALSHYMGPVLCLHNLCRVLTWRDRLLDLAKYPVLYLAASLVCQDVCYDC